MRLIDADELDIYDVSPAYGMCVMGVTQEDIDDAPTVDAIPVSWLTAQAENPSNSDSLRNAIDHIVYSMWAERKEE